MAGGKQSPRQKMINLMYLVFIAMLAIQVGREVLRSFDKIDKSITKSNSLTDQTNKSYLDIIAGRADKGGEEDKAVLAKAENVKSLSSKITAFIQSLKEDLNKEAGFVPLKEGEEADYNVLQNTDAITKLLFKDELNASDRGNELIAKIQEFNNYIKSLDSKMQGFVIDISDKKEPGGGKKTWLNENFYGQPMVAAKTTLTKLQSDIKTAEGEIMRSFLTTKLLDDLVINEFKGVISSPGILTLNKQQNTFAALGAFDNRVKGTAVVNGNSYPLVNGKATIPVPANSTGSKTLSGYMTFVDSNTGETKRADLEPVTYEVVDATITGADFTGVVTADKMNVLYVGVDNPVSATVSGVEPNTISLSGPGLRSTGRGKGSIKPSSVGTINLVVGGTTSEGKKVSKSLPFRVKGLPRPEAVVRGKSVTSMPVSSLANQTVTAKMPDDFGFDVNVTVTGFTVKVPGKPAQTVSGNRLGAASSVAGAKPGSTVTIFDIKTVASGGVPLKSASNNVLIEVN